MQSRFLNRERAFFWRGKEPAGASSAMQLQTHCGQSEKVELSRKVRRVGIDLRKVSTQFKTAGILRAAFEYQDLVGIGMLIRFFRDPSLLRLGPARMP